MNTRTFHKQYISNLDASRHAAEDIVPFWQLLALDEGIISQMELCLVEVVNNVFEHAYGNHVGSSFDIRSYLNSKQQLIIEISDYGSAMPKHILDHLPSAAFIEPVEDDPSTWLQSSRGLKIVQQLTDKLEYISKNNCNTFRMLKETL